MANNQIFKTLRCGIPNVREGEGLAGRGSKKKRMPFCSGRDMGSNKERYPKVKAC